MSSTAKPRTSTGPSTPTVSSGGDLIVTRGLQEMLERERRGAAAAAAPAARGSTTRRKNGGGHPTGPNFIVCYLCGRQFGSASIGIHRPQCYLMRMIEWERGDPSLRGPRPVDPETHERRVREKLAAGGGEAVLAGGKSAPRMTEQDAYNAAQFDAFNTQALAPCPNCSRTFLPDRLQVHLRSCRPGSTARPPPRSIAHSAEAAGGAVGEPSVATFGTHAAEAAAGVSGSRPSTGATPSPSASQPRAGSGSRNVHGVSYRPSGSRSSTARLSSVEPSAVPAVVDTPAPVTTILLEESAGEESEAAVTEVGEEAAPISPVARADALVEGEVLVTAIADGTQLPRRLSVTAEPAGTSTPRRYASMEPGLGEEEEPVDGAVERERSHAHAATPTARAAAATMEPAQRARTSVAAPALSRRADPAMESAAAWAAGVLERPLGSASSNPAEQRRVWVADGSVEAQAGGALRIEADPDVGVEAAPRPRARSVGASVVGAGQRLMSSAGVLDGEEGEQVNSEGNREDRPRRRIPLNNVSRFKNVPSRVKMEREQQQVSLTPCRFCGRTFNPLRVETHEGVCTERHKAPAPAVSHARKAVPAATPSAAKHTSLSRPTGDPLPAKTLSPARRPPARFCTECGVAYGSPTQKFCGSCGARCAS